MNKFSELTDEITSKRNRIKELKSYFKENNIDRLKSFFNSDNRTRTAKEIYGNILKEEIEKETTVLNGLLVKGKEISTFNFKDITIFLCDIISIIEGETYIKMYFNFSDNRRLDFLTKNMNENICVIASYEDIKMIKKLKDRKTIKSSIDIMELLGNKKYILLDKEDKYSIYDFDNLKIVRDLVLSFPYLRRVLLMILDLKLNGSLSDDEIFNSVKESITPIYNDSCKSIENIK